MTKNGTVGEQIAQAASGQKPQTPSQNQDNISTGAPSARRATGLGEKEDTNIQKKHKKLAQHSPRPEDMKVSRSPRVFGVDSLNQTEAAPLSNQLESNQKLYSKFINKTSSKKPQIPEEPLLQKSARSSNKTLSTTGKHHHTEKVSKKQRHHDSHASAQAQVIQNIAPEVMRCQTPAAL